MVKRFIEKSVLPLFPESSFIMAYGSGVFTQSSYSKDEKPVVDLIVGVKDSKQWHKENITRNSHHYSFLKYLPNSELWISKLQKDIPARIYFNTLVPVDDMIIKYGVIEESDLIKDLNEWSEFYCAGRLQKPSLILKSTDDIDKAQENNLTSALSLSCLLLPDEFTKRELFMKLASLSYLGDPRMKYSFENPKKVSNIVDKNYEYFDEWYKSVINEFKNDNIILYKEKEEIFHSFIHDEETRKKLIDKLPNNLKQSPNASTLQLTNSLSKIVQHSSQKQTLKGFLTAGITKSISYGYQKFMKSLRK